MTDFLNKVLAIILAAMLLLIAPLNMSNLSDRAESKLKALNEMQLWLDTVCDKGSININDLNNINDSIAATGIVADVIVEEYRLLADASTVVLAKQCTVGYDRVRTDGGTHTIYNTNVIRIHVIEKAPSSASRLWSRIIGVEDMFDETLSAMRR